MSLADLLSQDFFYLALAQILLFLAVGLPIGYLLVHKNLGLFSDTLSHSLIPGIAGAIYCFGLQSRSIRLGALAWGLVVSVLFPLLGGLAVKNRDSLLVVISLLGISAGLVVNQTFKLRIDFSHLLFGSPLLTSEEELLQSLVFSSVLGLVVAWHWKKLLLFSIDPDFARLRYGAFSMNFRFTMMTSLLVIMGFDVFGVLLTTGLLLLPTLLFERQVASIGSQMLVSIGLTMVIAAVTLAGSALLDLTFSASLILVLALLTLGRFVLWSD